MKNIATKVTLFNSFLIINTKRGIKQRVMCLPKVFTTVMEKTQPIFLVKKEDSHWVARSSKCALLEPTPRTLQEPPSREP